VIRELSAAYVEQPVCFAPLALALSIGVRVVLAILKCYELAVVGASTSFWSSLGRVLVGLPFAKGGSVAEAKGEYLTSLLVGFLEFVIYPILMAAGAWAYIGAWVAFKTVAQYKHWGESRSMFNRFLAGNALVLLLGFIILVPYVKFR
jgi:hypothetical protein